MRQSSQLFVPVVIAALGLTPAVALAAPSPREGHHCVHKAVPPEVSAAVPDTYPALGFEPKPAYLPNNVIVLTFDDGPDWGGHTAKVLDVLKEKNVKATFFINRENWSNIATETAMQDLVKRMVNEGHELASHTSKHLHLPTLTASGIEAELADVEDIVATFLPSAPPLTLVRAPFGEPYQDGNGYDLVAPVVAEHAVHIGWNVDSKDYECPVGDEQCVISAFKNAVKTPGQGAYGIVLMHSVWEQTAESLPEIIDYARANGFEFWLTEQVVCARFDKTSRNIVDGTSGGCNVVPGDPDAGVNPGDPDAGTNPGDPDAGTNPGNPDAGSNPGDPDAGPGGNNDGDDASGCGCRVGGRSQADGLAVLAGLAGLGLVLSRRRRR
jgi:peptidoglycan/xylan/chitin deacetylase (PgdA/CDA1 family)